METENMAAASTEERQVFKYVKRVHDERDVVAWCERCGRIVYPWNIWKDREVFYHEHPLSFIILLERDRGREVRFEGEVPEWVKKYAEIMWVEWRADVGDLMYEIKIAPMRNPEELPREVFVELFYWKRHRPYRDC